MKISELTTPFEHRRVIVYGSNNNPVHHWYEVRPIAPPYYMGNVREDHGDRVFDLFLFLPNVKDGIIVKPWILEDQYDVETWRIRAKRSGVFDKDSCVAELNRLMKSKAFIGTAMIEFVAQWDTKQAALCAEYRFGWYAMKEEQERQCKAEAEAKEAARRAEENARKAAEDKAERDKYLGWADNMTVLRFGKVHSCMETLLRSEGKIMTRRDFIITRVKEGWRPELAENVKGWYRGRATKPKTEYRLRQAEENCHYTVTKTEYEFAKFLVECSELPAAV